MYILVRKVYGALFDVIATARTTDEFEKAIKRAHSRGHDVEGFVKINIPKKETPQFDRMCELFWSPVPWFLLAAVWFYWVDEVTPGAIMLVGAVVVLELMKIKEIIIDRV